MKLSPIVDHGYLLGLGDDDHPQYLHLNKAAQTLQRNLAVSAGATIDGVDISAHAANASAHHSRYTNAEAVAAAEAEDPFDHAGAVNIGGSLIIGDSPLTLRPVGATYAIDFKRADGWNPAQIIQSYPGAYGGDLEFKLHPLDNVLGTLPSTKVIFKAEGDVEVSSGNIIVAGSKTVDGVDISAHAANASAHHTAPTASPTANSPILLNANARYPTHFRTDGSRVIICGTESGYYKLLEAIDTGLTKNQIRIMFRATGSDGSTDIIMGEGKVDGVDISAHAANGSAHHARYTNAEAVAAVSAGNLTKLVVETNTLVADGGKVGIGKTGPTCKLDIQGIDNANNLIVRRAGGNIIFQVGVGTGGQGRMSVSDQNGNIVATFTSHLAAGWYNYIKNKLGIGVTVPGEKLDVDGNIACKGSILKSGTQTEGRCHAGLSPFEALAGNQVTVCFREKLTNTPSSVTLSNVATTDENNMEAGYPQALRASLFSFGFFIRAAALGDANSCDKKFVTVGN